ncbi:cyclic nucleotide-binding domain-containing protein 2-like [Gigantopelta aegis]|uniref:cyclic nucleotide-binding domain-containing protein 2-like n=1 Tax=Gigantopelta aegis TaxID=1735272 RepID=UPI001B8896C3|nr:cyclic nucleotide-binding domain-containing protein 2-like [Gigantopelta aegis]
MPIHLNLYSQPLVRFRRAGRTVMLLLKATVSTRQNQQRSECRMLSWTQVHDDIGTSRRAYERFGLTFDPGEFKVKRETQINADVKLILSMEPEDRTPDQQRLALVGLNSAVEVFGEFPIKMQQSLVRVGWYERFEAKRVIIRQGHTADNFYFILSGTAVVTVLETNSITKEQYANTVALLKKGNSFGELALMHGARRSATVTCKDDVELLAVGRDDFVDIFMHVEKNREPDHIRFLHSIDLLQGWPIHTLPYNNPNICLFTYFRRGVLLCKDSNSADWIYVIKSGTCRVLKSLTVSRPRLKIRKKTAKRKLPCKNNQHMPGILSVKETSSVSKSWSCTSDSGQKSSRRNLQVTFSLPRLHATQQDELQRSAENHMKQLDAILRKRSLTQVGMTSHHVENDDSDVYTEQIFVEVQKMGPKDIYGLEQAVFSLIRCTTSTSLVSDGAECVLINRKFFLRHLSEDTAKSIRKTIQPLPSEEALRHKLENKASWEAFKTSTLVDQLVYRKHVHDYLNF